MAVEVAIVGILVEGSILGYFVGVWLHKKLVEVGVQSAGLSQNWFSQVKVVCQLGERIMC